MRIDIRQLKAENAELQAKLAAAEALLATTSEERYLQGKRDACEMVQAQCDEWKAKHEEMQRKLAAAEARETALQQRLWKYEPKPEHCEHGVPEGDWCEPCNAEYKAAWAAADNQ